MNVITNSQFQEVNSTSNDAIKLHKGYKEETDSLHPQVIAKLKTLIAAHPSNYKIVFTGHSLGAAQAAITVFYIFNSNEDFITGKTIELYTYGQPRVGNRAFADFMNNLPIKIGRVVERADVITQPSSPAGLGFYHFQHEIWVREVENNGTDTTCSRTVYEDPNCSASLALYYTVLDHFKYYHVDLLLCYTLQDPIVFLLQFIVPLKPFIPPALLRAIPILPFGESGEVAELIRILTAYFYLP